jgi:hypothetical protein
MTSTSTSPAAVPPLLIPRDTEPPTSRRCATPPPVQVTKLIGDDPPRRQVAAVGSSFEFVVGGDGPGIVVICEHDCRPDEDAVFERSPWEAAGSEGAVSHGGCTTSACQARPTRWERPRVRIRCAKLRTNQHRGTNRATRPPPPGYARGASLGTTPSAAELLEEHTSGSTPCKIKKRDNLPLKHHHLLCC